MCICFYFRKGLYLYFVKDNFFKDFIHVFVGDCICLSSRDCIFSFEGFYVLYFYEKLGLYF